MGTEWRTRSDVRRCSSSGTMNNEEKKSAPHCSVRAYLGVQDRNNEGNFSVAPTVVPCLAASRWAKASLARVSADWQAFPGANKSKVHLTCMTTYQSAIAEHTTTGEMERAVSSFMDTTKERSHLWVVDDGSTHDGHLRQLYALKRRYGPRLHLLLRNRNGGISAAKNSCIKAFLATSAQYLSLVDHDVEFKQYGWQESYEAAIDCGAGHLHLNIWSTEAKPGAMYTLKDLPPGNNYTDLQAACRRSGGHSGRTCLLTRLRRLWP